MKMNKVWLPALALTLAASFAAPLRAQDEACKADIERLCKGIEPGDDRLMRCLIEHEAELSAPCKATGEALEAGKEVVRAACKGDLDTFCKSVEPGEGRLIKCIREHEAELSGKCKAAMAKEKEKMKAKDPCGPDEEKFCKNAKGKDWRACVMKNEKKFSKACRASIAKRKEKAKENHPCAADMEKLCKDVPADMGAKIKCLIGREAEVSEACKARMAEEKAKMMKNNPCVADIEKFCKDMEPGEGRIMNCLLEHKAELSEACKAGGAKMKEGGKMGGKEGNKGGKRGKMGGGGPKGPPPEAATDSD